jgi:hypothetical protein
MTFLLFLVLIFFICWMKVSVLLYLSPIIFAKLMQARPFPREDEWTAEWHKPATTEDSFLYRASNAVQNIISCFANDHRNCRIYSLVCNAHLQTYSTKHLQSWTDFMICALASLVTDRTLSIPWLLMVLRCFFYKLGFCGSHWLAGTVISLACVHPTTTDHSLAVRQPHKHFALLLSNAQRKN